MYLSEKGGRDITHLNGIVFIDVAQPYMVHVSPQRVDHKTFRKSALAWVPYGTENRALAHRLRQIRRGELFSSENLSACRSGNLLPHSPETSTLMVRSVCCLTDVRSESKSSLRKCGLSACVMPSSSPPGCTKLCRCCRNCEGAESFSRMLDRDSIMNSTWRPASYRLEWSQNRVKLSVGKV